MLDLLAWKDVLDSRRTAIEERPEAAAKRDLADDAAAQLLANAIRAGLGDGLQILRGDIGAVVIKGFDDFAVRPIMSDSSAAETARFRYDLNIFYFDGGLCFINSKTCEAPRLDALRKLVERQRGLSFLLFLTINVRNTVGPAIADYLYRLQRQDPTRAISWYLNRGKGEVEHRLKAIVPILLGAIAQSNGFALRCLPPVAYTGHSQARMVHFICEFQTEDLVFAGVNHQSSDQVLMLPMLESRGGAIGLAELQHPQCDPQTCRPLLGHLTPGYVNSMLGAAQPDLVAATAL